MQHANLHGIHADVFHHGLNLRLQHLGRHTVNGAHAHGVLRRDGGDGRHAKAAQGREGFEISLNACAAAAVGASDGQNSGVMRQVQVSLFSVGNGVHGENYEAWA